MRYFTIDTVAPSGETDLYEYESYEEFVECLLENRSIAEEYGDKVESEEEVQKELNSGESYAWGFNAFIFVKGEELLNDYGYEKGEDY